MGRVYAAGLLTGFAIGLLWSLIPALVDLSRPAVIQNDNTSHRNGNWI